MHTKSLGCLNRRYFLTVVASAAAVSACSSKDGSPAPFGDVSGGNVKDIQVGALFAVGSEPCVLGRDAKGLYAMTLTCTHEGCDLQTQESGNTVLLDCPCHGSRFDRNGVVTRGPANSDLTHFAVEVDAMGEITIHGGKTVGASVRTPVPA